MTDPTTPDHTPDGAAERRRWSQSGDAWDRWADQMAEPADRINQPLLDLAEIRPGQTILDLACGAGEPALSLAARVGDSGLVLATDLVTAMMAGARRRQAAQGSGAPILFAAADMQALPLADAGIDAATCRFGLMFVPDIRGSLREVHRVLRPGGRFAAACWGPLAENTLFAHLKAVLDRETGPDDGEDLAALFRFAAAGSLTAALSAAGFADVREESLRPTIQARVQRDFWRPTLEMAFAPRLARLTADRRDQLERAITARFAALADTDGTVPLHMHVRLVAGLRP